MKHTEGSLLTAFIDTFHHAGIAAVLLRQVHVEDRILDGLYVSPTGMRIAIEAKISRADFRNESDAKRAPAWLCSHRCVYLAPKGIIPVDEIPDGWGLVEIDDHGSLRTVVEPTPHEPVYDVEALLTMLMRRLYGVEERIRLATDPAAAAVASELRAEALEGMVARRDETILTERRRSAAAAAELETVLGTDQVCADCLEPVTMTRQSLWRHTRKAAEKACAEIRREAERARRQAATGSHYLLVEAPPVQTKAFRDALTNSH